MLAAVLRELRRAAPTLLVDMLDAKGAVKSGVKRAGTAKLGDKQYPAITYADGGTTFTIYFAGQAAEKWLSGFSWVALVLALFAGIATTLIVRHRARRAMRVGR